MMNSDPLHKQSGSKHPAAAAAGESGGTPPSRRGSRKNKR